MTIHFEVAEELVVVGRDPEMADYSNPRGELVGEAHYIVGTYEDGRRIAHEVCATTRRGHLLGGPSVERLERLAAHLNEAQPALNPDLWRDTRPVYGSEAYVSSGQEFLDWSAERAEEGIWG